MRNTTFTKLLYNDDNIDIDAIKCEWKQHALTNPTVYTSQRWKADGNSDWQLENDYKKVLIRKKIECWLFHLIKKILLLYFIAVLRLSFICYVPFSHALPFLVGN